VSTDTTTDIAIISQTAPAVEAPPVNVPELDISQLSSARSDVLLRSLAKNCLALKVSVSAVGYERLVKNATVAVGEHEIAPEFLAGARFKVVPNNIKNPLGRIAGHARQVPYSYGTPFIGGAYLIPIARDRHGSSPAQKAFTRLGEIRGEYRDKAIELRPLWESHVAKIQSEYPFEYEALRQYLPNGESFVAAHTVSSIRFPLGAGLPANFEERLEEEFVKTFRGSADEATLWSHQAEILSMIHDAASDPGTVLSESASETWLVEAQEQTSQAVADAIKTMIQEPLKEFAEALANIEGILARGSSLKSSTLTNLRASFEKLQGFSFMAPTDLKQRLRNAASIIGAVDMKDINGSETSSRELVGHFKSIREDLTSEETHTAVFGQFMRGLDL
jgi:hypothetical protein